MKTPVAPEPLPWCSLGAGWSKWFALALGILVVVFQALIRPRDVGYTNDAVFYAEGAKSIAEGHGYSFSTHLGEPRIGFQPPVTSLYLSAFWRLKPTFPENIPWLVLAMVALSSLVMVLMFVVLTRQGLPTLLAAGFVGATVLSPIWFDMVANLYADIPFTLAAMAAAVLWCCPSTSVTRWRWLATGLCFATMYLTKTAALAPIAGMAVVVSFLAFKGNRMAAIQFLAPVLVAWILWHTISGDNPGYREAIRLRWAQEGGSLGYLAFCSRSAGQYLSGLPFVDALFPLWARLPNLAVVRHVGASGVAALGIAVLALGLMACAALGLWRNSTNTSRVTAWLAAVYLLQLVLYPYWLGPRLLFILLPFLVGWAWQTLDWLAGWTRSRSGLRVAVAVWLTFNLVANGYLSVRDKQNLERINSLAELREMGTWIQRNTPPASVIAVGFYLPVLHLHAYTHRRFVNDSFQLATDFSPITFDPDLPRADYILTTLPGLDGLTSDHWSQLAAIAKQYPGLFGVVAESSRHSYRLLKIDRAQQELYLRDHFFAATGRDRSITPLRQPVVSSPPPNMPSGSP